MLATSTNTAVLISFIVPAYNVESYLRKCLESILALNDLSYEVVLIDDGSTDGTIAAVQDLIENNRQVKLIRQTNKGMSASRNRGLDEARGQYIAFVDSDDFIAPSAMREVVTRLNGTPDILIADFNNVIDEHICPEPPLHTKEIAAPGLHFLLTYFSSRLYSVVWRNIYRLDFLKSNNIRFMEGVRFEDAEWTPRCLYLAQEVLYVPLRIYNYRKRSGSTINSGFTLSKFTDLLAVSKGIADFSKTVREPAAEHLFHDVAATHLGIALYHNKISGLHTDDTLALRLMRSLKPGNKKLWLLLVISKLSKRLFYQVLLKSKRF